MTLESTVNSRSKSTLENAREKLRDDPGGTKKDQTETVTNLSNMEATTATTPAATTTTKYYNKTKLQQQNNNNQQLPQNKSTTATTNSGKKAQQQQQTYRDLEDRQEPQKKLTAKQAKQAAKLEAQQKQQQQNVKNADSQQQQQRQQQQHNKNVSKTVTSSVLEKEKSITNSNLPATTTNIAPQQHQPTTATTTTANNANKNINNNLNVAKSSTSASVTTTNNSGSNMDYVNSISNSSNFNKSDTTTSSNSNNKEQLSNPTPNSTSDNFNSAGPGTGTGATGSDNNWSNSKYLHKKFKRLASTTETEGGVGQDAEKLRTTSISSASSSVSSPPPPPSTPASAIVQPQNETTKPAHETNQQQQHHNLQNGYLIRQEVVDNAVLQNKILLQMAQQQQVVANNTSTSNNPAELSNGPNSSASSATATNASGGSGRYICPYCNLSCTKPSVLQKHIRAHTNERPYPCDICGIAFKTKSNLYKHCRSRSHAARQKGIEVPPDADDGLSDQDVDPELSNSSSEMLSRTDSPMEDVAIVSQIQQQQQQMNEPHTLIPTPMNSNSSIGASPLPLPASPASRGSAHQAGTQPQPSPIAHQQQQQQHQSQLPLGSPAAGTLAPTSATINQNNVGGSNSSAAKQAIDYKPYKPKFHNAALYNSPKEAAAAAAAAATTNIVSAETNPTPAANTRGEFVATSQPPPQTKQPEMGIVAGSTGVCLPQALNHQQYQQLLIEAQKYASSQVGHSPAAPIGGGSAAGGGGQPPSSVQHQLHHHPTLSPSTQIKLNNHISSHQLQQQLQQQQQQLHQLAQAQAAQHPHHLLAPPPANALSLPLAAAAYYLGPPPGAFYNPMTVAHQQAFASLHLMTQQEQQQFRHQLQLQQHLQQLQHSGVITPATVVAAPQPPPPPSQPTPLIAVAQSGPQTASSPSPGQNHIKTHTPVMGNTGVVRPTPTSVNNTALHLSKPSPAAIPATNVPQQSPLHYLASAALNSQPVATVANNKLAGEIVSSEPLQQQHQMSNNGGHQRPNANHNSQNSNNAGEVPLNKENLHERINKIISQNEAIVENKELLLQKKYPKTLNRSRSFTNANNSAASGSSAGSTQTLQSTTGGPPSESPTNAKLAQVIVQKQQLQQQQQQQQQLQQQQQQYLYQQQLQQQQQQMQKQRHMYSEKVNMEDVVLPLNGTSKNVMSKHLPNQSQTQALPPQSNQPLANQGLHPSQMHPYRGPNSTTNTQANSQHQTPASTNSPAMANVPLNLSAKSKAPIVVEERIDLSTSKQPQGPLPQQPPPATPRKRHSIEQASQPTAIVNPVALNEASNSSNSNSQAAHQATAVASSSSSAPAAGKYAPNHSIIKNLLLNARGLAVPMGEGEDAVYICPLCSTEFRTAEDLQLHNSAYCQGNNSSANSPASSPSHKYFRSSSIHSLNMSDLKILSKNPLSLAKLAWSQLKIKPSNLVLDRLSASQANTSKSNSSTTTSETSTQPSCSTTTQLAAGTSNSTLANQSTSTSSSNNSGATAAKSHLALNDIPIRFVDAPLPSPGPLLGKTPLVDYTPNDTKHKSEEVIITKMHDDRMYTNMNFNEHHHHATVVASSASSLAINNKRLKFETSANNKRLTNITSGGEMQPLNPLELSKKEERLKRFTSSGGCMIPLSECDDVDKSPKMIRTPLLSGGSFQEVSPKKETKLPVPLIQGAQLTPKLALGLSTSSSGPQHFQFPPINQITAFNPLTLPLTEKVIPYVPGIPGPNSLTPQMHLAQQPQQQQQLHLQVPPQQKPRTVSPNRKLALSPNEPGTSSNKSVTTFGGVQNVPSEFSKAPPTANMRNVKNWNSTSGSSSNKLNLPVAAAGGEVKQSSKSFNFLRMADNLSPRKLMAETETRHFNLERVAKDQLNIQQPTSVSNIGGAQALSPTAATSSSTLTPLHVDTSPGQVGPNESAIIMESKPKSKFLRPTSLPLRPGTFTPKRHHGITPTANTLPLISPETPRPSKECVQLYLNGNSYTYLGLKSSTKTFYCTLNCPQPSYVQDMHKLSMYSMWQQCAENNPHPLGLKPKEVMSLYDSRQKVQIYNMAESKKLAYTVVDAQQMVMTPFLSSQDKFYHHQLKRVAVSEEESAANKEDNKSTAVEHRDSSQMSNNSASTSSSSSQTLVGGYESNENYTYIRGRGRGKYVCSECGIRCKKPSMLKKHIRTHTDVRPYTCKHCNFSFKTKGNLTKHMQSKTHYKKCIELGLNPGPMPADGEFLEPDMEFDQQSSTSAGGRTSSMGNAESDTDGDSSDNETESSNESDSAAVTRSSVPSSVAPPSITVNAASEDNKSHLEHEAARCLLSLSMTPPIHSQSTETSAQMVVTTVMATSATATTTTPSAIRRVISYTSPKPPFDYQKQEQYYSNPEEAMPKNKAINNFEAAPMDLTKPRSSDVSVTTVNSLPATVLVHASLPNSSSNNKQPSLSSLPGPVQTQAQIDDVIFGGNRDESGLLKTMISVSSKVARSQPGISEEVRNLNEDMMLYDYRREQTLQYNKIKQTQLSRSLASTANEVATTTTMASSNAYVNAMSSSTATTVTQVCCSISSVTATVISSRDSAIVSSGVTTTPAVTTAAIMGEKSKTEIPVQVPKIEVVEPVEQSPRTKSNEVSSSAFHPASVTNVEIRKPPPANQTKTSSDESEETDDEPPAKKHLTMGSEEKISGHNSNLPAAVLQPGTTDFSGVLSGGSNSSSSAGGASSQLPTRTVIVGEDGFTTTNNEILPVHPKVPPLTNADGRPVCSICSKTFQKQPQLILHMNIHYMERKYKCDPCGVSFRTQGHLQKHERSEAHKNKVIMTSTFGVPTTSNPRPFECTDCKIAFRIHGHLAKHLRSKTHVQKLECLQKLPFGTYAEIERAGISLTEIDTSDCENSLISLRLLAQKLIEKHPSSKLGSYTTPSGVQDNNSNTGLVSQDSASEDGFQAAASAAASAIASLDNDSAANTPRRANSTSEDESIAMALNNNLKRRLPGAFSNGDDSDKDIQDDKRLRQDLGGSHQMQSAASPPAN
ncbi:uncharacterized protein LOC101887834 isoform X2 [Musca domestica]|nr:uncharacterized protein LOC101887834 isoform X2 [Musca domestica]